MEIRSERRTIEGMDLHSLEAGPREGRPVLLLHGWPTHSRLWRGCLEPLAAAGRRAIALDLPGFGASDKPLDVSYSFPFFRRTIDAFLAEAGVEDTGLAVHDLGGPIGLYWATCSPERITEIALLNTIVFPEFSWAVKAFVTASLLPGVRAALASPAGIRFAMRLGTHRKRWTSQDLEAYVRPFRPRPSRRALLRTAHGLHRGGFHTIAEGLSDWSVPTRIVYGERDRILPEVARTMRRVAERVPHAEVTSLPHCGHFLQEDDPERVGAELAAFFGRSNGAGAPRDRASAS